MRYCLGLQALGVPASAIDALWPLRRLLIAFRRIVTGVVIRTGRDHSRLLSGISRRLKVPV
jgi:hypothetical protein